ncbi:MAG: PLP-dependent aminotransferase family protein, partial [Gammaproteobacteria bacterium]|nr:PLP-dependent aminotransferase family protein [Gammaproteobacteria bacterium]
MQTQIARIRQAQALIPVVMKYKQLANDLEHLISSRVVNADQRLPSIRSISRSRGLSISTVTRAFHELERRRLVEARPRSGYFACAPPGHGKDEAQSLSGFEDIMPRILAEPGSSKLLRLGIAQLEPDLVPRRELNRIARQMMRTSGSEVFEYAPSEGCVALRRRICEWMFQWGATLSARDIVITSGCQEALSIAVQCLADQGDTVAAALPTYPGLLKILQSMGMKVLDVPSSPSHGLDLDRLEAGIKRGSLAAVYVMANGANPNGMTLPDDNKRALIELAAKYDLAIIEDDTNHCLNVDHEHLSSIKSFDDRGLVIYCSSFSKTVSPALRVGWMAPGRVIEKALELKYALNLASPTLPQHTLER